MSDFADARTIAPTIPSGVSSHGLAELHTIKTFRDMHSGGTFWLNHCDADQMSLVKLFLNFGTWRLVQLDLARGPNS